MTKIFPFCTRNISAGIFSLCCIICLILPLLTISEANISERENRILSNFPSIIKNGKINQNFGLEFNNFINDHIGYRQNLIDWRAKLIYTLNGKIADKELFVGDDGWIFPLYGTKLVDSLQMQKEKIAKAVDILKRFSEHMKNQNVPVYVVLQPDREQIYQTYWKKYYPPQKQLDIGEQIKLGLKKHKNIHLIYPQNIFKRQQQNVFFKNDLHVNGLGATILLKETIKAMSIDIPQYDIIYQKQDYDANCYSRRLGLPDGNDVDKKIKISFTKLPQNNIKKTVFAPFSKTYHLIADTYNSQPILAKDIYLMGICYTQNIFESFFETISRRVETTIFWPIADQVETIGLRKERIRKSFDAQSDSIVILVLSLGIEREWNFINDAMKGI